MQKEVEGNKRITQCMGCMEIYEAFDDICPYCGYINGTIAGRNVPFRAWNST